jgi:hypothetical protein
MLGLIITNENKQKRQSRRTLPFPYSNHKKEDTGGECIQANSQNGDGVIENVPTGPSPVYGDPQGRPASLEGLIPAEIYLLAESGELTPKERAWFGTRKDFNVGGYPSHVDYLTPGRARAREAACNSLIPQLGGGDLKV